MALKDLVMLVNLLSALTALRASNFNKRSRAKRGRKAALMSAVKTSAAATPAEAAAKPAPTVEPYPAAAPDAPCNAAAASSAAKVGWFKRVCRESHAFFQSCKSPIQFAKKPASSPATLPASAATTAKSPIKPTEPPPAPHTPSASSNKGGDDAPQRSSSPSAPTAPTPSWFKTAATKLKTKCTAACDAVANPFTAAAAATKLSALRLAFKGKLLVANKGRSGSTAADDRSDDASEYASANSATPSFLSLQSCTSFSMAPDAGYYDAVPAFSTSADDGEVLLTVDTTTHTVPSAAKSAGPDACPKPNTKANKRGVAKKIVRLFLCGAAPSAPAPKAPTEAAVCCSAPAAAAAPKPELGAAIAAKAAAALLRVSSRRRRPDQEGETAVAA